MDKNLIDFEANFSVLDRYGTLVTKEEYVTDPAIGRDQQIKELILVLLTPEKSAILIGKPGIGKTAIVEGLAYRIQQNDVPEALKGYEIINIKTASLLGTMPSGESKVQKMIDELKTREKLILFIDEVHMLIGATDSSSLDFANIFKEGLGRGSIKVIGATTTEEYERYILRDKAFTRRFQKIEVPEPSREETIKIMMGTLPKFEHQTGRKMKYTSFIQERIMSFIVDITSEYKRVYALGSRYPDVCLTLLKQAFSYTVYDNRQYMDIFDVRKAIENSKNIYPDVIKKELPNFDKTFNDIILEEKGEKPIEEWRKDNTMTRSEIENQKNGIIDDGQEKNDNKKNKDPDGLAILEKQPELIDRKDLKDGNPVQSIITSTGKRKYAKVGSTDVSKGLKEKINRTSDVSGLDDLLLSSDVGVLKQEQPQEPKMPTQYVITDELVKGAGDNILLGKPIGSTINNNDINPETNVEIYRTDNTRNNKKNEGRKMWNNGNSRPERMDISNQNFDKYNNFFHRDDFNYNQNPDQSENEKRMDMLMGPSFSSDNVMVNNGPNNNYPPMDNNMGPNNNYPPMNNMMGPNNNYPPMDNNMGPNNNYPPMNNNMGPNNNYPPMNNNMGPNNNYPPMNNMGPNNNYPPMDNMMGPNNNYPPMDNNMGPNNNFPPMNNNMGPNNNFQPNMNPTDQFNGNTINTTESLFGAPMYGDKEENKLDNIPDIYGSKSQNQMNNSFMGPSNQSFIPNNQQISNSIDDKLFGAPMYSNGPGSQDYNQNGNEVDIFGQLITDNMRIKNGKIVDEFPTFDKIDNLSNIKTVISDVREVKNNKRDNNNSFLNINPNQSNNNVPNNQNMMNPNNQNMFDPNIQNNEQQNTNKRWTFIDNNEMNAQNNQQSQPFTTNILEESQNNKEENTISATANSAEPTNNKDYYEDMKTGDFVNFTELNSGKIKEEDTNKYMGVQTQENKPQFDLNLENNTEEKEEFDDFFE